MPRLGRPQELKLEEATYNLYDWLPCKNPPTFFRGHRNGLMWKWCWSENTHNQFICLIILLTSNRLLSDSNLRHKVHRPPKLNYTVQLVDGRRSPLASESTATWKGDILVTMVKMGGYYYGKLDGAYRVSLTVSNPNKFKLNFFAILLVVAKYY